MQLQDLLDATRQLVSPTRSGRESDSDAEDLEHIEKLRQVKAVLEEVIFNSNLPVHVIWIFLHQVMGEHILRKLIRVASIMHAKPFQFGIK